MTIYDEVLQTKNKKFNVYGFHLNNEGDQFSGEIKNRKMENIINKNKVIEL